MGGVRLSFALDRWAQLGYLYPPALLALEKIASEHQNLILSGEGSFIVFHEYQAINCYIGKSAETLEPFLVVDENFPSQAVGYYISIKELLIDEKKFNLLKNIFTTLYISMSP